MALIETVPEEEAEGRVAELYKSDRTGGDHKKAR
jgi:hypothetical protein